MGNQAWGGSLRCPEPEEEIVGVPVIEGRHQWQDAISRTFVPFRVDGPDTAFTASLEQQDLGSGVSLTRIATDPSRVSRTPSLARDGRDEVLFLLHLHGTGEVDRDGRRSRMVQGFGSLHTADRPYELRMDSPSEVMVLKAPRQLLAARGLDRVDDCAGELAPSDPGLRVFRSFAQELLGASVGMAGALRAAMGQTALDLLVSALQHTPKAGQPSDALRASLMACIRDNAHDPSFDTAAAAALHGVSVRYVQQLFARSGLSPAAAIRNARVALASSLLSGRSGLTIEGVAWRSGFQDAGTFTRAFKRVHGVTPAQWRAGL